MRTKVAIVQNIVPHYRRRLFEILSNSLEFDITIVSGTNDLDGLKSVSRDELSGIRHVASEVVNFRVFSFGPFTWQPLAFYLLSKIRPQVIVVHGGIYDLTSWIVLLYGRIFGVRVLSWTIGLQRREHGIKLMLRKCFYALPRGLLLYGDYPKKLLLESGLQPTKMHVIYNSLDVRLQRVAENEVTAYNAALVRNSLGISTHSLCLLFIGRLVPRKRLAIAISAIAKMHEHGDDFHLILIGEGSDTDSLKNYAIEVDVASRVHFVGAVFDELRIAEFMAISHATIVPEAGLPIIHPMGYGLPAIIADCIERHGTEWEAVREGSTGFFYKDGDVNDLVDTIRKCFADKEKLAAMRLECRELVAQRYSSEAHARRIAEGISLLACS